MEGGLLSPSFQGNGYGRVSCEPEPALQKVTARCRGEDIVQEPTEDTQCAFKQTAGAPRGRGRGWLQRTQEGTFEIRLLSDLEG